MRLFKYLSADRLDVLRELRIRFTQPVYFNDPFEFSPTIGSLVAAGSEDSFIENAISQALGDNDLFAARFRDALDRYAGSLPPELLATITPEAGLAEIEPLIRPMFKSFLQTASKQLDERWRPETRENVGRRFGVLSLSEVRDSILMWAHYADSHRGFVLGLDAEHRYFDQRKHGDDIIRKLAPVVYSDARPSAVLLNPDLTDSEQAASFATAFLLTKSLEWQYEREWRMLLSVDDATETIERSPEIVCLYELPPEVVSEIVVGSRMTLEAREALLRYRTDTRFRHVRWFEARINDRLFKIDVLPLDDG